MLFLIFIYIVLLINRIAGMSVTEVSKAAGVEWNSLKVNVRLTQKDMLKRFIFLFRTNPNGRKRQQRTKSDMSGK